MTEISIKKNIRFFNVGEDPPRPPKGVNWNGRRQWNACTEYNFLSAGQGLRFNRPLLSIEEGDVIAAYITGKGYVGIGIVEEEACAIKEFSFKGKKMEDLNIDIKYILGTKDDNTTVDGLYYVRNTLFCNANNDKTEFVLKIKWKDTVSSDNAKWEKNYGLFSTRLIQCSIKDKRETIAYLNNNFDVKLIL